MSTPFGNSWFSRGGCVPGWVERRGAALKSPSEGRRRETRVNAKGRKGPAGRRWGPSLWVESWPRALRGAGRLGGGAGRIVGRKLSVAESWPLRREVRPGGRKLPARPRLVVYFREC